MIFSIALLLIIVYISFRIAPKEKEADAHVHGAMASIVEWQSLRMQEYRYSLLIRIARLFELVGVRKPLRFEAPVPAGDYDHALHVDHPEAPSLLEKYLAKPEPKLGGAPKQTETGRTLL